MTLRPGPPHEWDEDRREDTLRIRGVDSLLVERMKEAGASGRKIAQILGSTKRRCGTP